MPGADLTETELRQHARSPASDMRPLHYAILEPGAMPLNGTAKIDITRLRQWAHDGVSKLPRRGRWDG